MEKARLFGILQKLGALSIYEELLPDDFKTRYLLDLDKLKKEITSVISEAGETKQYSETYSQVLPVQKTNEIREENVSENHNSKSVFSSLAPKQVSSVSQQPGQPASISLTPRINLAGNFGNYKRPLVPPPKQNNIQESIEKTVKDTPTFHSVTGMLIPILTEDGEKILKDFSLSIDFYKTLKIINGTSTLHDIYTLHAHNYKHFLEFASLMFELYTEKYIYFVKNQITAPNRGWIKMGEIFSEGNVTSDINVSKATTFQKNHKGMFIGEALLELNYISDEELRNALKIQRWLSKLAETSPTVASELDNTASLETESQQAPDINLFVNMLDNIIPVFSNEVESIFNDPKHKVLSERLKIIDGKSSILKIFNDNQDKFSGNKFEFLKFILKLESYKLLFYQKEVHFPKKNIPLKYGELLVSLELLNDEQIEYALSSRARIEKLKTNYLGEVLAELGYITTEILQETLKIHRWCNRFLNS